MSKKIEVLVVRPLEEPKVETIEDSLESYYKLIGCQYIEAVYPWEDNVAVVLDEEGKLNGQMPNRALRGSDGMIRDVLFGTFFICGLSGCEFDSITDEMSKKYSELFHSPEAFVKDRNGKVHRIVFDGSEPAIVIA